MQAFALFQIMFVRTAMFRHGVETVSSQQELKSKPRIVIDAGHGGIDGGTTSVTGKMEKELNLEISQRLACLLRLYGDRKSVV